MSVMIGGDDQIEHNKCAKHQHSHQEAHGDPLHFPLFLPIGALIPQAVQIYSSHEPDRRVTMDLPREEK